MGEVYFYHLTQQPPEAALPAILTRALANGWRTVLRGTDAARMDRLDQRLWEGPEDRFIPHGLAGGPHDALQPVLLTHGPGLPDDARCLIAVDGAEVDPGEAQASERVCILFEDSESALARARDQWRTLTGAGLRARYWSDESGQWTCKRDTGAPEEGAGSGAGAGTEAE